MKKLLLLIIPFLFFLSCNQPVKDSYGCFPTLEAAKASSKKTGKDILVIATMEADDQQSSAFIINVIQAEDFSQINNNYSVVCMDFSKKAYDQTVVSDYSDKKAVKEAERKEAILKTNMLDAKLLNVSQTPSFYLLSKHGCFISQVEYTQEILNPSDFSKQVSLYSEKSQNINNLADKCLAGSSQSKLEAIDELYNGTDPVYRPFLLDFADKAIKLSTSPETKSKYLLAKTDALSSKAFLNGDPQAAVEGYVKAANQKYLTPEYKQQAWYMAGYLLAMSDYSQYDLVIQYLQNAVQAAPDSADAASIQRAINEMSSN
ncbi:MAG: hypothetical protein K5681_06195 [Treponema sp.]|nr:hypothetical protein [Treponema sp.]